LEVARQELLALPKDSNRHLIILSDSLEDDPSYRFVHAPELANVARAETLAARLRTKRGFALPGVPVCLGRLESSDSRSLSLERKEAVQAFWTEYLDDRGKAPNIRFDGTGMLAGNAGCYDDGKDAALNKAERREVQ
jgi:hypothetical protein